MRRFLFWAAAAVVSAGVAFAVTVPGALEHPEGQGVPEAASPQTGDESERVSPETSGATEARQAETVETSLLRVEPLSQNTEQAQRQEPLEEAEAERPDEAPAPASSEEQDETGTSEGAAQQTAAVPPAGPFAESVLQAPTSVLPVPESPATGPSPSEAEIPSPLAGGPLSSPQTQPSPGALSGQPSPTAGPLAAPRPPQQPRQATLDELALGSLSFSAECGLILRPQGEQEAIFAAGVSLDPMGAPAAISIDGELVALQRVGIDGEPLGYSQFPRQLFQDEAQTLQVLLEIALEEGADSVDSARVSNGEITVALGERPIAQVQVGGRAGC